MGEFNVNKSDGSLEQTAGMPSEYPASQVMMSDDVTSVENAVDDLMEAEDVSSAISITGLSNISNLSVTYAYKIGKMILYKFSVINKEPYGDLAKISGYTLLGGMVQCYYTNANGYSTRGTANVRPDQYSLGYLSAQTSSESNKTWFVTGIALIS